jgi:hypothetical protein
VATPRPLTAREREVLEFLVSIDSPAAAALRAQVAVVRVTGECECGCGAITLDVDRERVQPAGARFPITTHNDPPDPEETLWLMLWGEEGWISDVEIAWVSAEAPRGLPSTEGFAPPEESPPRNDKPPRPPGEGRWSRWRESWRWHGQPSPKHA